MYFPSPILSTVFAAVSALAATTNDSTVERLVRERVESRRNAGMVVGIIDSTGRRRIVQYGRVEGERSAPVGPNTVFEIGSITKTFTATLLADMKRRGEVSLDDPVTKYLPPDVQLGTRSREITLLDLATQTSGLPALPGNFGPRDLGNPYADYATPRLYASLSGYMPAREPGTLYLYSNYGFGLLGNLLSRHAGISYERLIEERILAPLRMSNTHVGPARHPGRSATGHNRDGDTVPNWTFDALAGAGALRSNLHDMMTFLAANLDSASVPLGPTLHDTHRSQRPTTIPNTTIGLSWHILHANGTDIIWHNGETAGCHAFIGFDIARHVGVVILSNSATSIDDLGFHLIDARNALRPPPAPPLEVALDTTMLQRYAGTFELAPGLRMTVTRSGGKLYAQITGQPRYRIFAITDSTYRWTAVPAQLTFHREATGAVTRAVLQQGGRDIPMIRVP